MSMFEQAMEKFPGYTTSTGFVRDHIKKGLLDEWLIMVRSMMNSMETELEQITEITALGTCPDSTKVQRIREILDHE